MRLIEKTCARRCAKASRRHWLRGTLGLRCNQHGAQPGARLCGEARLDQILLSQSLAAAVDQLASFEALRPLTLKGFRAPHAGVQRARAYEIDPASLVPGLLKILESLGVGLDQAGDLASLRRVFRDHRFADRGRLMHPTQPRRNRADCPGLQRQAKTHADRDRLTGYPVRPLTRTLGKSNPCSLRGGGARLAIDKGLWHLLPSRRVRQRLLQDRAVLAVHPDAGPPLRQPGALAGPLR